MTTDDGRRLRGNRTRESVLETALNAASIDGLNGLTLGRLATGLGISKSALFTHWPDKQALQLAVVEQAAQQWEDRVARPALEGRAGLAALWALQESRQQFYIDAVLPGRCFFVTTQAEFDDHPGPVQDRLRTLLVEWEALQVNLIHAGIQAGELRPDTPAAELAFELDALGQAVVTRARLLDADTTFAHARRAILDRLRHYALQQDILPAN
ncbi:TetR/AcrR family transcriptional regulator [Nocardia sp. NPDC059240]|uniref:TetR/AcrR family transcriptional regulator n=1 Tax=Nocardia sp. NPDC059240 TaxID=3346786 RepID=UPI0036998D27